jgi:abortive infection bacteriophage resistance protein
MRTPAGIFMSDDQKQTYCKPALSLDAQIDLLISRGLEIPDRDKARHYLRYIGYYRLSGYYLTFQQKTPGANHHTFKKGVTFGDILDIYIMDRELRLLVMDAIERIEVAFRACLSNVMSEKHGPHWYMDQAHFVPRYRHGELLERIKRETLHDSMTNEKDRARRERFIQHYYQTYCHPELPPGWMVFELLSLGTLSQVYAHLISRNMQKEICRPFGINHLVMTSWMHTLTYLRNLCAHHLRLWNRRFSIMPVVKSGCEKQLAINHTLYAQVAMLHILMSVIADGSKWQRRLSEVVAGHPKADLRIMGFPADWRQDSFWRLS